MLQSAYLHFSTFSNMNEPTFADQLCTVRKKYIEQSILDSSNKWCDFEICRNGTVVDLPTEAARFSTFAALRRRRTRPSAVVENTGSNEPGPTALSNMRLDIETTTDKQHATAKYGDHAQRSRLGDRVDEIVARAVDVKIVKVGGNRIDSCAKKERLESPVSGALTEIETGRSQCRLSGKGGVIITLNEDIVITISGGVIDQ